MLKAVAVIFFTLFSTSSFANQSLVIDGKHLEFEIKGEGDTWVLFDAGALTGMAGWDSLWHDLPDEITAIRFSRLGEGNSEMCESNRSSKDLVDEVQQVLKRLDVDMPFVYIGHSLGGATARNYAATYPENVLGMLLVDPENPKDVEMVIDIDPVNGPAEIERIKQKDYTLINGHCFLDAVWSKKEAKDFDDIGDIPVTLIASTQQVEEPKYIFHTDEARKRWGELQHAWVSTFPQGRYIATTKGSHYVQKDEPELVLKELALLLERIEKHSSEPTIAGLWSHAEKPAVIKFDMTNKSATIYKHDTADSTGLNLIKHIQKDPMQRNRWTGSMFDGYNNQYVDVAIQITGTDVLTVTTSQEEEVLRLIR
ncbi:alpha/beta fold hydrolase [Alteromonas sp. ASW11-130]|uniref:alpha/beta fold hydrolase n=1 Tax=Alteromonas sp. ASW11-130 TaxID=3015775 RepID=UPI002241A873|nr:alpha/beta hydrolase [Alteromonas sp. ASW11-130]MCW8091768.1 alpha/beta hydrolase [Alteromonas sp. ASW11-130]